MLSSFAAIRAHLGRLEGGSTITLLRPRLGHILLPLAFLTLCNNERPFSFHVRRGRVCGDRRAELAFAAGLGAGSGPRDVPGLCSDAPPRRLLAMCACWPNGRRRGSVGALHGAFGFSRGADGSRRMGPPRRHLRGRRSFPAGLRCCDSGRLGGLRCQAFS